jgi:hypothetical protein
MVTPSAILVDAALNATSGFAKRGRPLIATQAPFSAEENRSLEIEFQRQLHDARVTRSKHLTI